MAKRAAGPDRRPKPTVIRDPRAIRALAHPARLAVLGELSGGRTLTATECAEVAGLTPSAMSYHLRSLQRWGLIERAPEAADGRERPWRAVPGGWRIESDQPEVTGAAESALAAQILDRQRRAGLAYLRDAPGGPWRDASTFAGTRRYVTLEQLRDLDARLRSYLDELPATDPQTPAARPVMITYTVFPTD